MDKTIDYVEALELAQDIRYDNRWNDDTRTIEEILIKMLEEIYHDEEDVENDFYDTSQRHFDF